MNIKQIDINDKAYAQLAAQESVFNSPAWLNNYGNDLRLLGLFNNDNKLFGAFFIYIQKKAGITRFRSAPYTPHCGLFFHNPSKNRSSVNSFNKEVMEEIVKYLHENEPSILTLAFSTKFTDLQYFNWSGYKVVPNYTYQIDLSQSLEEITREFDPKNRNIISKVEKEEYLIEDKYDKESLFTFLSTSLAVAGAKVYNNILKTIICNYSTPENSFVYVLKNKEGQISSAVMCIYDQYAAYYLLAGNNREQMVNGANNLLVYKCIKKAKELGCRTFDFEGSMIKSVEKFFRSFGGQIVPYYTVNKGKFLIEAVLKLKMRSTF